MARPRRVGIAAAAALVSFGVVFTSAVSTAGANSAQGEAPTVEEGVDFPAYYDGIPDITTALAGIVENHPDVYAGMRFDDDLVAIVVGINSSAPIDAVAEFEQALATIPTSHGISILTESKDFAVLERQAVVDEIYTNHEEWEGRLGAPIVYANLDEETGEVTVGVDGEVPNAFEFPFDIPVSVVESPPVTLQAGNRKDDRGNWTAGNWLGVNNRSSATTDPDCTQGFTWRKWGVSGLFGGLARHCPRNTQVYFWWHNGRGWGDLAYTASSSDSALFAPAAGTAFSPTVWVGPQATTTERTVVGAQPLPMDGTSVALSGAKTGLNTAEIVDPSASYVGVGPVVVTDTAICDFGDSGGPWLTTLSSPPNNVIAHGQHVGEVPFGAFMLCAYLPVHQISAALGASIATG